ncbi:MAG: peptidase T [Paludibacteraceae bacterium]|nr:peptidase T [Paludibacteraceae bacterium]MBQ6748168.1 peptidase T [Paludibacteraceae bacterium]MBQ6764397.1 peptidase T [Paludibacteraceae bacterium]MBR0064672.1 peptidase T [Paludibacteraceae bacterium]MBR4563809.1 peptidase T [Paludibacteraceae bacterium]
MDIVDRFLKYVSFCTTSDENTGMTPSTPGQMEFAGFLADELKSIGLKDVSLDSNGYIMATLESNLPSGSQVPVIGFIAHMDTSPDASGKHVQPRIVKAYDGKDVMLNEAENIVLETAKYPEILRYTGQDIIVTNGKTLLGADDKAGIAEIVTAMEYLVQHPEIKHGKVRIGFTPDEEIGQGADHFDVKAFGADFAYTMDGGAVGELEFENFNAASCKIHVHGVNVHPGSAYHKMRNSMRIAYQIAVMLPRFQTPEHTQDYEGFYHLIGMNGTVEETTLSYIIRDHDRTLFEYRKRELEHLVRKINTEYGEGTAEIEIRDQYYNMREKIEPVMHIIDLAKSAMESVGVTPVVKPIRGGTDGARLSFEGLPCPNIFAGGENFHSRYEYLPIPSMEKACQVILEIIKRIK